MTAFYCAPLEGVTGYAFRRAHARYFAPADKYFAPFFAPTQEHVFPPRVLRELSPANNAGVRAVPQLLCRSAEDFVWAANALAGMGYGEVNLNLGCPSGTVTAKGKGSGLLSPAAGAAPFPRAGVLRRVCARLRQNAPRLYPAGGVPAAAGDLQRLPHQRAHRTRPRTRGHVPPTCAPRVVRLRAGAQPRAPSAATATFSPPPPCVRSSPSGRTAPP